MHEKARDLADLFVKRNAYQTTDTAWRGITKERFSEPR